MNVRDTENGGILDGNEFRYVFSVAEFSTADDDDPESERDGRARKGNKKKEKRSIIFRASGRIRGSASRQPARVAAICRHESNLQPSLICDELVLIMHIFIIANLSHSPYCASNRAERFATDCARYLVVFLWLP